MNSYGYISSKHFKLGSPDLGGAITAFGRLSLNTMKEVVNKKNKEITGKDIIVSNSATDANYFVLDDIVKKFFKDKTPSIEEQTKFIRNLIDKVIQPTIDNNINEDFRLMNGYINMMSANREVIASHGLITGISRYCLRVTDDEGKDLVNNPKMKTVGMPNISTTIPKKIRRALDEVIEIMFDYDNDRLIKYIEDYRKVFSTYVASDLSLLSGVSNVEAPSYYVAKASRIYNIILKDKKLEEYYEEIMNGDKVYLIHLKPNDVTRADTIAIKDNKFLIDVGLKDKINYDLHFEKLFLNNVDTLAKIVKWNLNKNSAIMDLF